MTKEEKNCFLRSLPKITEHLASNGGKTLISRIYGIFKLTYAGIEPMYMMLQRNNIPIQDGNEMLCKFDLKGSRYQRRVLDDQILRKVLIEGFEKKREERKAKKRQTSNFERLDSCSTLNEDNILIDFEKKIRLQK